MKPFLIGIAGGSGSGKTTVAKELKKHFGKNVSVLHLDNYQKFGEELPRSYGMKNREHPKTIRWIDLLKDISVLKNGKSINIFDRDQKELSIGKQIIFNPKETIIVEGYFLFYKKAIRDLLDFLIYLETGDKIRKKRRISFRGVPKNPEYISKVLLPMHKKYIEPTKKYADFILNTDKTSVKQCSKKIIQAISYIGRGCDPRPKGLRNP